MPPTSENLVLIDRNDGIATVTLNRPEALNALSSGLRAALVAAFDELRDDPQIEVVILTGAGRAFTVGLDLKELGGEVVRDDVQSADADLNRALGTFDRPIIGAVNGFAITGGFELALACDLILASENAKFADTHARVGILPGWGLSQRLPRLIGVARAKEISFSGNTIDAALACEWGLVNRVVKPDALLPASQALAGEMASCVPHVLTGYKKLIDEGLAMSLPDALVYERNAGIESAKSVSSAELSRRREGVQSRGRKQSEK